MTNHMQLWRRLLCALMCATMLAGATAVADDSPIMTALPTPTPIPANAPAAVGLSSQPEGDAPTDPSNAAGLTGESGTPSEPVPGDPAPSDGNASGAPTSPEGDADGEGSGAPDGAATGDPAPSDGTTVPTDGTPAAPVAPENKPAAPQQPSIPSCDDPECPHVDLDERGNPYAVCAYGTFLLAPADDDAPVALTAANAPIERKLRDGKNTIYRSGTYKLTEGGAKATLSVAAGLVVSLMLDNAQLLKLTLSKKCAATLSFTGQNTVATIAAASAKLDIDGTGCLTVTNLNCAELNVLGGSADLPDDAKSENGCKEYAFPATGATSATVDGVAYPFTEPHANGNGYLWLPEPVGGVYQSQIYNGALAVSSQPKQPESKTEYSFSSSEQFLPMSNTDYSIVMGSAPDDNNKRLSFLDASVSGVTLSFSSIGTNDYQPSVYSEGGSVLSALYFSGQNILKDMTLADASVTLSGSGSVQVGNIHATASLKAGGSLHVQAESVSNAAVAGWQRVIPDAIPTLAATAYYNGGKIPMLSLKDEKTIYLPLPDPNPGTIYTARLDGNKMMVEQTPDVPNVVTLGNEDVEISGSGNYLVISATGATGNLRITGSIDATITLDDVRTTGDLSVVTATTQLKLQGSCQFGALSLSTNAKLKLSGTGALYAGAITGSTGAVTIGDTVNLTLGSGAKLPGSSLVPTVITVTDDSDKPMEHKAITLKLGREGAFDTATTAGGFVTLWRKKALNNIDAVVLSDTETYATIIGSGKAAPIAIPVVTNMELTGTGDLLVETDVSTAVKGVLYIISKSDATIADKWPTGKIKVSLADASGICPIPKVGMGRVLTARAFASVMPGTLSADTVDAFGFGDQKIYRAPNIGDQEKYYDQKVFEFKEGALPEGASVVYYKGETRLTSAPKDVGDYIARVTVPSTNTKYMPGEYDVPIKIKKITVTIYPDMASKRQGEPDPEFTYTYEESAMFEGDTVTGKLIRVRGERYGNYAYLNDQLVAPEYYYLYIDPTLPSFFIDWGPHHYLPYDPFKKIDPVYDDVVLSTGRVVRVQIATTDVLKVDREYFGNVISDTQDGMARPFTPTLRLRGGYDSLLLILTTEPELNEDGGYQTDLSGNRVLRGRKLKLSNRTLNVLRDHAIDYIALSLDGMSVVFPLDNLRSGGAVSEVLAEAGLTRNGSVYTVAIEPINGPDDLLEGEAAARAPASLRKPLLRVSAMVEHGEKRIDLSPAMLGATVVFDAGELMPATTAELDATGEIQFVDGKPVAAHMPTEEELLNDEAIAVARGNAEASEMLLGVAENLLLEEVFAHGYTLCRFTDDRLLLDTSAVVPYTVSEEETAMFGALMRTKPYLSAEFYTNGLYGLDEDPYLN